MQPCRQSRSNNSGSQTLQFVGTCVPESVGKHQPQIQMNNWCRRRESTGAKGRKRGKNTGTKGHQDKKARENTCTVVTKRGKTPATRWPSAGKHRQASISTTHFNFSSSMACLNFCSTGSTSSAPSVPFTKPWKYKQKKRYLNMITIVNSYNIVVFTVPCMDRRTLCCSIWLLIESATKK